MEKSFSPRKRLRTLFLFLSVLGPGIIAANADNDAGGISTYSIVGAHYGYTLLWVLLLITISLAVTQEMGARIGMVTGKGLSALIRERFGVKLTVFAMITMFIANLGTATAEYAGIASSFDVLHISKYLAVPLMGLLVWLVLYKGSFKMAERIFLIFSCFYFVYIVAAFKTHPDWSGALTSLIRPSFQFNFPYILTAIALIGTTITPWGQFFIQSYIVDKGLTMKQYAYEKWEIYFGAFLTDVISFFIIVTTANTLFVQGIRITSAADAALALEPLVGHFAEILFSFGLFSASMLGAFILPVATAYPICEALGWEWGFNRKWHEAKEFYCLILLTIALPAFLVLLPGVSLFKVMLISQDLNGILLPIILIYLMKIVNDSSIMGKYVNKPIFNVIAWVTIIALIILTMLLVFFSFFPSGFSF